MDPDQFLMGAPKVPSFKFDQPGATVMGTVVFRETRVQTVYRDPRLPKAPEVIATWPSGDPKYQLVVHLQTQLRDPMVEGDTGLRAIYIKGRLFEQAVRDAVKVTGAPGIQVGGYLSVRFSHEDMTSTAAIKPKVYAVQYQPAPPQGMMPGQPQQQYGQPQYAQGGYVQPGQQWAPPAQAHYPAPPRLPQQPPVYLQHDPHMPAHHEQGPPPEWATGSPAQVSEPVNAPPAMSTLAQIRAASAAPASGQPFDGMQAAF